MLLRAAPFWRWKALPRRRERTGRPRPTWAARGNERATCCRRAGLRSPAPDRPGITPNHIVGFTGMHSGALSQIQEYRQRVCLLPARAKSCRRFQGGESVRLLSPALIHGVIGKGLPQCGQARIKAIDVLNPKLHPLAQPPGCICTHNRDTPWHTAGRATGRNSLQPGPAFADGRKAATESQAPSGGSGWPRTPPARACPEIPSFRSTCCKVLPFGEKMRGETTRTCNGSVAAGRGDSVLAFSAVMKGDVAEKGAETNPDAPPSLTGYSETGGKCG